MPSGIEAVKGVRKPRVSVVVGNYNQAEFVKEAIVSVASQSYRDLECVVVDDGSSDDSVERIRAVLADLKDDRFRFVDGVSNGGHMANLLRGLDATSAPFIAYLDADDIWYPDFVERHVNAHLSTRHSAAVSTCNLSMINADGELIAGQNPMFRVWHPEASSRGPKVAGTEEEDGDHRTFFSRGYGQGWLWSTNSGLMYRRHALEIMRPLAPQNLGSGADGYWVQAAHMMGGTVRLDRVLGDYRLHGANIWAKNPFLGAGSIPGATSGEIVRAIETELQNAFLARLPELMKFMPNGFLRQVLLQLLGRPEALRLSETDPTVRNLLSDWATTRRKLEWRLTRPLPRRWRPRNYR